MAICKRCERDLPDASFALRRSRWGTTHRHTTCRECLSAAASAASTNRVPVTETRTCKGCGADKPFDEYRRTSKGRQGLYAKCRDCRATEARAHQAAHGGERAMATLLRRRQDPEADRAYQAAWHEQNKPRRNADARERRTTYTPEYLAVARVKTRAKKQGIAFALTEADIVIPDVCPVLGIPLAPRVGLHGPQRCSPSIDRIDPNGGYVPGNVAVISHRANTLKSNATIAELEAVLAYMRRVGAP